VIVSNPFESDELDYRVLVNADGQHSLWPDFREIPAGWSAIGPSGPREKCLEWIDKHWTDMRPKTTASLGGSN
jgi:MbtH protein